MSIIGWLHLNDDQRQDSEGSRGMVRRTQAAGTADGNDSGSENEANPMVALVRLSKALAPWYRTIFTLCVFVGSLLQAYDKIADKIDKHDAIILKAVEDNFSKNTQIPFYQIKEHEDEIVTLQNRMDFLYDYINAPYKNPKKKRNP